MTIIPALSPVLLLAALAWLARTLRPEIQQAWRISIFITLLSIIGDAVALALLPRLGLSFGPFNAIFLYAMARLVLLITELVSFRFWPNAHQLKTNLRLFASIQVLLLGMSVYSMYIEPFRLGVTTLPVQAPAFLPERPLRILHITDLHVERTTSREREMLAKIEQLQPDLIVLTGDYLNIDYRTDPESIADAHAILAQLHAPYGVYAITGSPPVDLPKIMPRLFTDTDIRLLDDETTSLQFPGGTLAILGVSWKTRNGAQTLEKLLAQVPKDSFTLLLYHSPDLIEAASQAGIDLYLAGHTHGGQVRLPFYGAIVTFSRYGKEFEMGKYTVGPTTLYVSRGVGMEGLKLPRLRFLAPPELVLVELGK